MQNRPVRRGAIASLAAFGLLAIAMGFGATPAGAQGDTGSIAASPSGGKATRAAKATRKTAPAYALEFRSRYALSYGHTFVMFGRLNNRGQLVGGEVAGLHPAGDSPVPWMIGHVLPVPSETGPSDGDLEEQYVSARYRITLSEAEDQQVVAHIRQMQASSPVWSAVAYNCNSFVGDIAKFMGLRAPASNLLMPADYINSLRELNGGQTHANLSAS